MVALQTHVPPFRFAVVQSHVYRGAYPRAHNYTFLHTLHLKTLISLVPHIQPDLASFCTAHHIEHLHFHVEKAKDNVPLTNHQVAQILTLLIQPKTAPVYVHCMDGTVVTGMIMLCLRRLQLWHGQQAVAEFVRFTGTEMNADEIEFMDKFASSGPSVAVTVTPLPTPSSASHHPAAVAVADMGLSESTSLHAIEQQHAFTLPPMHASWIEIDIPESIQDWVWPRPHSPHVSHSNELKSPPPQPPTSPPSLPLVSDEVPLSFIKHVHPHPSTLLPSQPFTLTYAHPAFRIRLAQRYLQYMVHVTLQQHPKQHRTAPFLTLTSAGHRNENELGFEEDADGSVLGDQEGNAIMGDEEGEDEVSLTVKALALEGFRRA